MLPRFEKFTSNITKAYKYIIKIKTYEMREFGLRASHVMCLFFVGKHADGLTAGQLAELCSEDKAAVSKALSVLKEKGFVAVDNENGKKKYRAKYIITDKGHEIYDRIVEIINNTIAQCTKGLGEEERQIFYTALEKIVNNMENLCSRLENTQ